MHVSRVSIVAVAASLLFAAAPVAAQQEEPWTDPDPPGPPERHAIGEDFGFSVGAEYRAQGTYVNPISLNTINERRLGFIEHRLRLDASVDYDEKVRIVTSIDILDGVLWGDNGTVGTDPEPEAGTTVNARSPNEATPCIGYKGGENGDPLKAESYGFVLCDSEIFSRSRSGTRSRARPVTGAPTGSASRGEAPTSTASRSAPSRSRPSRPKVSATCRSTRASS